MFSVLTALFTFLPYDPAITLLDIYLKNRKTLIRKDMCTPMFTAALFTIANIWKQFKCPSMGEWIKKMLNTHTPTPPTGILLSHKKEQNLVICENMDET